MRTIGDPDIRFREDPVRILRAIKFAARCNLTIEPETYRRMLEHAGEIQKCAQARVSEEFYRLLRAGAAKRSMELLLRDHLAAPAGRRPCDAVLRAPTATRPGGAELTKRALLGLPGGAGPLHRSGGTRRPRTR